MVVLRSGRKLNTCSSSSSCSSSIASKSGKQVLSHFKLPKKPQWTVIRKRADDPSMPYVTEALKSYNQNSGQNYKLVLPGSLTPVFLGNYFLYQVDFEAKNTHAPTELFFAELTSPSTGEVLSVRLCVSLGPLNSISGDIDKLNGCYYCRKLNNVYHPKGGGFVRGGDQLYKTVEHICGINEEKHFPTLKKVSQDRESKKEGEYTSKQVVDAMLYAAEAITIFNQKIVSSLLNVIFSSLNQSPFLSDLLIFLSLLSLLGFVTCVMLPTGLLFHVNFTAKDIYADDDDYDAEMFFAELMSTSEVLSCKLCVCLSAKDIDLGEETGDCTNGCYYCRKYNNVLHPNLGGFVRGGDSLYKTFPKKGFLC